ncbi:hypothetical protein IWW47_003038 [Coemansia sp. RSA 2052]|nr:hypothetical protein IWW47_003038 [Coemansia sp. RSA 2052]
MKPKPDSSPAVYQSHQQQKQQQKQQQRPALPLKPVNIDYSDPESRRQKEREAAELWESKFGIGSANPSKNTPPVATTTTTKPATILPKPTLAPKPTTLIKPKPGFIPPQSESPKSIHPSAENDAPKLPFSSARSAVLERMAQQRQKDEQVPASNPALENTPPPLPYSASRRTIAEPLAAPIIERAIQPNPRQLIAQLNNSNGNGNARGAGGRAFEDNFDPLVHTVSASISSSSTHRPSATPSPPTALLGNGGGVPLTLAREVRGTRPPAPPSPAVTSRSSTAIAGGMAHRQPVLPPKPAKQQLSSASSRSVSFASHHPGYAHQPPESSSTTTPTLLSPALSFSSSSNGGGSFQSPLTTTIHRSSVKPDAIPADALARYAHLFKRLDKQHGKRGFLNADEVHAVVVRCRLPDDLLRRIWALSDRNLNGKFGPAEFYIIMHLTDCALRQEPIPEQLSVDLLRSAYQS